MTGIALPAFPHNSNCYQIAIEGRFRASWSDWMNGMEITTPSDNDDPPVTLLVGRVADQAALRGILCRLWDLNLNIISIQRLDVNSIEKG